MVTGVALKRHVIKPSRNDHFGTVFVSTPDGKVDKLERPESCNPDPATLFAFSRVADTARGSKGH